MHRIFIVAALACALVYAGWEALGFSETGEKLGALRAVLALAAALGIGLYLRSLRALGTKLTPRA